MKSTLNFGRLSVCDSGIPKCFSQYWPIGVQLNSHYFEIKVEIGPFVFVGKSLNYNALSLNLVIYSLTKSGFFPPFIP